MSKMLVRHSRLLLLFSLFIFFIACASAVPRDQMINETAGFKLPAGPAAGKAVVYVVRPDWAAPIIKFNVFVNNPKDPNLEMGYTKGQEYIYFTVAPGDYVIYSVAETPAQISLKATAGKTYFIRQFVKLGVLMARNDLQFVDDVEGKWCVKKCKNPGTIKRKSYP